MNTILAHYSYRLTLNEETSKYEFLPTQLFGSSPYLDSILSKNIKSFDNRWSNNKQKLTLKFADPNKKGRSISIIFKGYWNMNCTGMLEVPDNVNDCIFHYHTGTDEFHFVVYKDAKERKEMLLSRWDDDFAYEISHFITTHLNS